MLHRLLFLAPMLAATLAACTRADPPLLIDGGQAPATTVQEAPSSERPRTSSESEAISR
jgi:hypothetical protein